MQLFLVDGGSQMLASTMEFAGFVTRLCENVRVTSRFLVHFSIVTRVYRFTRVTLGHVAGLIRRGSEVVAWRSSELEHQIVDYQAA